MTAEQFILNALREHQRELGLSHRGFAKEVGISASSWVRLLKPAEDPLGRCLGVDIALAAQKRFPDLEMFVSHFILREYPARKDRNAA